MELVEHRVHGTEYTWAVVLVAVQAFVPVVGHVFLSFQLPEMTSWRQRGSVVPVQVLALSVPVLQTPALFPVPIVVAVPQQISPESHTVPREECAEQAAFGTALAMATKAEARIRA